MGTTKNTMQPSITLSIRNDDHSHSYDINCALFFEKAYEAGVLGSVIENLEINTFADCALVDKIAISLLGDEYELPGYEGVRKFLEAEAELGAVDFAGFDARIDYEMVCVWLTWLFTTAPSIQSDERLAIYA